METRYFYSESRQEAVCLRGPYHVENIVLSTGDSHVVKIAHYNDRFMYTLLSETWECFECAKATYDEFKQEILEALNLTVTSPEDDCC